jgi:hypothetical protein
VGETGKLPAELLSAEQGLRALAELQELTRSRWEKPPDVARLRELLAQLPDAGRARRLQHDLAAKAFLDGHPEQARSLLPDPGDPEHAAALLRDVKALVTGEGPVKTDVGRAATPPPGEGGKTPRGPPPAPPGVRLLLPEGDGNGPRPGPSERATADLPPLGREVAEGLREQVREELARERGRVAEDAVRTRAHLTDVRTKATRPPQVTPGDDKGDDKGEEENDEDRKFYAQVEQELKKLIEADTGKKLAEAPRLTRDEQFVARRLRRTGATAAEVALILYRARTAAEWKPRK